MIERVHLRVRDIAQSRAFYGVVLSGLGWGEAEMAETGAVAFGPGTPDTPGWVARIWLLPTPEGPVGAGHVAVGAADRAAVVASFAAVSRAGGRGQVVMVPPLSVSAYLEDPDGHFLEATARISAREAVIFAVSAELEGVSFAGAEPIWVQSRDHNLMTLAGETPCVVTCDGSVVTVATIADLPGLQPLVAAARAMEAELTVHRLKAGQRYTVVRAFQDYYANAFSPGEQLTFVEQNFLPYDDGHTLVFRDDRGERRMYVQGGTELYANFGRLIKG